MTEYRAQPTAQESWIDVDRLLACIHCGLCLPSCPTHVTSGEEMPSPRGRLYLMRAVQEGRLAIDDPAFAEHELSCLVCRACETACPSGVEFGYLMEQTRERLEEVHPKSAMRRYIYTKLLRSRRSLNAVQRALAIVTRIGGAAVAHGLGRSLSGVFPRFGAMLRLAPDRVRSPVRRNAASHRSGTRVALMVGCIGDAFTREINDATIRVLEWLGYSVTPITAATCCGALAIHAGYRRDAIDMADQMVDAALETGAELIVTSIAGCGAMLKDYEHLLQDNPRLREYRAKVRDITEVLVDHLDRLATLALSRPTRVAYQAPCHLLHAQKVVEAPLAVIAVVGNVTVVPLAENELCCGSAGTYNIEHPHESELLLERKLAAIRAQVPDIVLTANAGCLMQLRKGERESKSRTPVFHIVEWIDSLIANGR